MSSFETAKAAPLRLICPRVSLGATVRGQLHEPKLGRLRGRGRRMGQTAALVEVLKRELRSRGVTYAQVARSLRLSEASVKRMFSKRDFTLKRLDRICELTRSELSDLARRLHAEENLVSRLSWEQER